MTPKKLLIWFVLCICVNVSAQDKPKKEVEKVEVKELKKDVKVALDTIRIQQNELQELLRKEIQKPNGAR